MTALSTRLQDTFKHTRTVCFGRFMIEVPATAAVVYGPAWAPSPIERHEDESGKLDERIKSDLSKINSELQRNLADDVGRSPLYGTVINGAVPGQKIIFSDKQGTFHRLTSLLPLGADLYEQTTSASLQEDALAIEFRDTVADALRDLNTVARHLRARADDDVPDDPGLCIDGAFIADNPAVTHERVSVGIRLKEFPDVHLSIEVNKNQGRIVDGNALEPRIERAEKEAHARGLWWQRQRFVEFRRAPRQLGAWSGFEYLVRMPAVDDLKSRHNFDYTAVGSPSDPYVPMLEAEMKSGVEGNESGRVVPSLSDEEAVALWDKLIGSIKPRPTGVKPQAGETADSRLPLGRPAMTGDACPETGWWRSQATALPVQGGRRHFFRAGESMPGIVLLGKGTLWQQARGTSPKYPATTVWELLERETPAEHAQAARTDKGPVGGS